MVKVVTEDDEQYLRKRNYWRLVGKLQYLVNTRPDIAYAVGKLARFASKPRKIHWEAAQQLLGYLRGSQDMRITYVRRDNGIGIKPERLEPECYADADFGGDKETRRSTTGIMIKLSGGVVVASSKRQTTVADSTTAAETIALHSLVKEALWVRNMLVWTGYELPRPTVLLCDNNVTVRNSGEGQERSRTKHMDIKYMFIRDAVRRELIVVKHIGTKDMVADPLTKGMGWILFGGHLERMGLMKGSVRNNESSAQAEIEAGGKNRSRQR